MISVHIDQCLHGYADGHRQLASSLRLSGVNQRIMRTLSDLSGPRLVTGFDDYLTGYQLPGERLYAFARTWYAYEAERPGCVWTHTLVLNRDALSAIASLSDVAVLFRRPEAGYHLRNYETTLSLSLENLPVSLSESIDVIARIITALYSTPEPVAIAAPSSGTHESMHLSVWRHYKSLTNGTFNFCTGAIQPRRGLHVPFDFQTVPYGSVREIQRSADHICLVDLDAGPVASWADRFSYEIQNGLDAELKQLLDDYGTFPADGRAAVGSYAQILGTLSGTNDDSESVSHIFAAIETLFPKSSEALRLKAAVASGPAIRRFFTTIPDQHILLELVRRRGGAFNAESLDVPSRLAQLWHQNPQQAIELLSTSIADPTPFGTALLVAFTEMCRSSDISQLCSMSATELVALAIQHNPSLAINNDVWRSTDDIRAVAANGLRAAASISDGVVEGVVASQLETRADDMANVMVTDYGIRVANAALAWAIQNKWYLLPESWIVALNSLGQEFVTWFAQKLLASEEERFAAPRLMKSRSTALRHVGHDTWIKCADSVQGIAGDTYSTGLFLLILHVGLSQEETPELLEKTFPLVYRSARGNALNETWWRCVEEDLGSRSWWDRCKTLRVGLLSHWIEKRWAPDSFIRALPDSACLYDLLAMWGWDRTQKTFLAKVIREILKSPSKYDSDVVGIAEQCDHWYLADL